MIVLVAIIGSCLCGALIILLFASLYNALSIVKTIHVNIEGKKYKIIIK